VRVVQTHLSFVFLTGRYAYKLKKPVRYDHVDFTTLDARRRNCEAELHLNRRLAPDVYLDLVRLTVDAKGGLHLGGDGASVDWLVKMRRLPERLMLDEAIRRGGVCDSDLLRAARWLIAFYAHAEPVRPRGLDYRRHLEREVRENARMLARAPVGARELAESVCRRLLHYLASEGERFERRIDEGRIVEGHGDLRPEHIFLGPRPAIIDCLEFSRELRVLDTVHELAYLAMESERLDAPRVGAVFFGAYREAMHDDPDPGLILFFKSYTACLRARLCARHLMDPHRSTPHDWLQKVKDYLARAARYLD
jgi:aminoglycoside phosphotransferase family enzyme